jgi:hypothetical protein
MVGEVARGSQRRGHVGIGWKGSGERGRAEQGKRAARLYRFQERERGSWHRRGSPGFGGDALLLLRGIFLRAVLGHLPLDLREPIDLASDFQVHLQLPVQFLLAPRRRQSLSQVFGNDQLEA